MLLEVRVGGSRQWYEEAMPRLEEKGFVLLENLGWSDPETDGEYRGFYYDYCSGEPLGFEELHSFLESIQAIILGGEAPALEINILPDR